ncbi:MAG TPA: glycoside hydrolase family protein [Ferruginibacter sp.]|jgi:hypothetical protein|nr:glycoside hydrolase family protein [Ferruginibacter sp.]
MSGRRDFLKTMMLAGCLTGTRLPLQAQQSLSEFSKRLSPVGRALELEHYYVWCNSPIEAPDGKIHVFFSRWPATKGMSGWINGCEIAHAVAANAESSFEVIGTVLAPRGEGYWDGTTCHNPHIQFVDGTYCLFYMGNANGKTDTKRIGLATANSLYGPWKRPGAPLLEAGESGSWDDHCTTNPAFVKHPNGSYWLYYKSWNTQEYQTMKGPIRGNRKYGLAIADKLTGPYRKYEGNPVIDFSQRGENRQFEDAFVWMENNRFKMLARDMGFYSHEAGLYFESPDGKSWSDPSIAYQGVSAYVQEPPAPAHLKRYGRFERPQLLFQNGKPTYLFTASQGGKFMTSSSFIFKINA